MKLITWIIASFLFLTAYSTTVTLTMQHGGIQRDFIVHLPTSYATGQHLPMVLNFHGYTSNASQQELYTKMDNTADANNFIVVYPNGIGNAWNVGWTGTYGTGIDDVGFTSAIIDTMQLLYGIDLNRVYATGLSNGGYLSHRLACELENRIAAIAAVAGTLTDSTYVHCNPGRIMPIMHIHGTADPIVDYNGAPTARSTEETINFWLGKNSCSTPGDTTDVPNTNIADGCSAQRINYPNCANGTRVLFYKINNGGHTWPNGLVDIASFGYTNRDFDGTTEIWNFFSQYSLNGTTGVNEQLADPVIKVYPNPFNSALKVEATESIERLEIYNLLGEKVFSQTGNVTGVTNLSSLNQGIYFLKVSVGGRSHMQPIIKN
jgi:polyhydroxybutyrate depolymerase